MNYKAPDNSLHFIEPEFAHLLPAGSIPITDAEAEALRIAAFAALPKVFAPISPRQIRQALTAAGLRTAVEGAVAAGNQDLKDWWEFASSFERGHPMVVGMGTALGKTSAEFDALFTLGASL